MAGRITLQSFAKINFYLDVLDKRADGYNNIETIFQTVSLCDTLAIEETETGLTLACDHAGLAAEADNLVLRAARTLQAATGTSRGAAMCLQKRIPVAAGLAGGSGDAAAAIAGLNRLWGLGLGDEPLAEIALSIGSDVPYCLRGGTALATGRGERIASLPELPTTWLVLVHPPVGVSAGWVYTHPALGRSTETPVDGKTRRFARALAALAEDDFVEAVFNRMEPVVFGEHPQLALWKQRLLDTGALAAAMSGSGPTLYGNYRDESAARAAAALMTDVPVSVVHTVPHGLAFTD